MWPMLIVLVAKKLVEHYRLAYNLSLLNE